MIEPHKITNHQRSDAELQEFIMFSIAVAGKTAVVTAEKMDRFIWLAKQRVARFYAKEERKPQRVVDWPPFKLLKCLVMIGAYSKRDEIGDLLRRVKLGKYGILIPTFKSFGTDRYRLDLRRCSVEDLLKIRGVKFKTANFFLLHSRPGLELAVPDTHILAELRERGYDVPKASPKTANELDRITQYVKAECGKDGMSMSQWDLHIWTKRTESKPAKSG